MTESSISHGNQTSLWKDELNGRRGPERTSGYLDMKELSEILRCKIIDSFKCKEKNFINYAIFEGQPVKLLQDRCYVTNKGGSGNDTGSRVLDKL